MKTFALTAGVVLIASVSLLAGADNEATPSIKQVMVKLNKGPNSPLAKLKTDLSASAPDWESIEKSAKDFVTFGAALTKNSPSKGDKASWTKLSDLYLADSKALDTAAKNHDLAAAKAAHQRLSASCKACHGAHKGKAS
ncbi:cytochrome c [Singulisphaera acidiphila]|uniref:Cytochrome C n=1 Tax=Singulisphaera acidiphila (strain ATCC BAA-1392 / DSM 18658 / VKM B-2454 / MOB10) TaxID=886293 RepID=L0DHD3_SINAD|nr:cytochrome c [Singulisphaera acidiphila]AGA28081.1 Cytochrome C'' [Singulisphaera acidiphila DSM 18658]